MLKKLVLSFLVVLVSVFVVAAQSGRRVRSDPAPAATPIILTEERTTTVAEEQGYSESAPNQARSIYSPPGPRGGGDKNKPKNKKENDKQGGKQTAPAGQTQNQGDSSAPTADTGEDEVLRIEANLVTIPVSVYDRSGLYVTDLRQDNFKIFEDGVEQEVAYFGTTEQPFSVILLIDVSPSTQYKIEEIQEAAMSFVRQLKPEDKVMVIQFDSGVQTLTELTTDRQKIHKAIRDTGFGGGTSLYDAVDTALRKRLRKIEGRKAIVLFTDGVDTTSSRGSYESTVKDAEESEAMIFPIYYNTYLSNMGIGTGGVMQTPPTLGTPFPSGTIMGGGMGTGGTREEYVRGRAYLADLSAATGGRVFRPEQTPGGLNAAFEGIAEELRRQYFIGYYPQTEGEPGQRKQIKVRVNRPRLAIRARDSYIVGSNTETKNTK